MVGKTLGAAAAAAAALALAFAAPSASAATSPAKPDWVINSSAVGLLAGAGLTHGQLQTLFGNHRTYLIRPSGAAAPPVSGALATVTFADYNTLRKALTGSGLPAGTRAVLYDNEDWSFTPSAQQRQPAKYEELAANLVHAHHLLFITAPAVDLTNVLAPHQADHYAAYLRLGLAASAARYADAMDIQAQGSITSLGTYRPFVEAAAAQARRANPRVIVVAGLSTNPSGQRVTSAQFTAAFNAVRQYVSGYWLNIPGGGPFCPRCGTPRPQVAVPLLRALARSGG